MPAEELADRYPSGHGQAVGDFEVFQCQQTTLKQYAEHGIVPNKDYGAAKALKCDTLVIRREPTLAVEVVGEHKSPGSLTEANWKAIAKASRVLEKCNAVGAPIGYMTDNVRTYWLRGGMTHIEQIVPPPGISLPQEINFKTVKFKERLVALIQSFDPVSGSVIVPTKTNPESLAREVWQSLWRLQADQPEDCLATFVELFVFKYLDDLGLLIKDQSGRDVSLEYVLSRGAEVALKYYNDAVRPYIKVLFPAGDDGYSIINGSILKPSNKDHSVMFSEIMLKFIRFGSLRHTDSDFKRRLYESFLQESRTATAFGQHFTPRKIVTAIWQAAGVSELPDGRSICDPAAGVAGFVLEGMAQNVSAQWSINSGGVLKPVHNWFAWERIPKTSILSRANALVHCGELIADQPLKRIKAFSKWLNNAFHCYDKTALGSLETMPKEKFDLILTNPPYVVSGSRDFSKIIRNNNARRKYFAQRASGVEGLFLQFIVQALKKNGDAWVLLPESFLLRTTDKGFRRWLFTQCSVDFIGLLPERSFYNTPKRVIIVHLKRRSSALASSNEVSVLKAERVLLFAVSEIGETRDAKRFPCRSDLDEMVSAYKLHKAGSKVTSDRAVVVTASDIANQDAPNIRLFWPTEVAVRFELVRAKEDPQTARTKLQTHMSQLRDAIVEAEARLASRPTPSSALALTTVVLGDSGLFDLSIGKRVLKKDIHTILSGTPLFSANVRTPFGYLSKSATVDTTRGGALWSIDSDFDCRAVKIGEAFHFTDHCGFIRLLADDIDPTFLAHQVMQAGIDRGFSRECRPSLGLMRELTIALPVVPATGAFDIEKMREWAAYYTETARIRKELDDVLARADADGGDPQGDSGVA